MNWESRQTLRGRNRFQGVSAASVFLVKQVSEEECSVGTIRKRASRNRRDVSGKTSLGRNPWPTDEGHDTAARFQWL